MSWLLKMLMVLMLFLLSPTLYAQYTAADYLNWTKKHLDRGNCDDAKEAYAMYKEKVPQGNAEVEWRIAECGQIKDLTFTVNDVSFKMVFVQGGTFQMGSESGDDDEKPVHSVTVSDFYMGEFEVTQDLWQAVMGSDIYKQRDIAVVCNKLSNSHPMCGVGALYPMYYVSDSEAEEFCSILNRLLQDKLPAGYRVALPTEAEWEYAAKGGEKSKSSAYAGSRNISDVAFYDGNYNGSTHQVGLKLPNELGLYDMSGNVCEWCADWADSYGDTPQTNPMISFLTNRGRIVRGGGFGNNASECRVTKRSAFRSGTRIFCIGFRLALVRR